MSLQGKGTIYFHNQGKMNVYIPSKVHQDSQFPFKHKDKVKVSIKGKKLIIEKS